MKKLFKNSSISILILLPLMVFTVGAQDLNRSETVDAQKILSSEPEKPFGVPVVEWIKSNGKREPKIGDLVVKQFKNAGRGGKDWILFGKGSNGGEGNNQLWLFDSPSRAIVNFTEKGTAVAFIMSGDHNDGFARFIVDGKSLVIADLFRLGNKTLVVSGLPFSYHTIQVVHFGKKNRGSSDDHVAIYGGAVLVSSELGLHVTDSSEAKTSNIAGEKANIGGRWKAVGFKRNRWFFKHSPNGVKAFYSSRYEIGRAEGMFENNKLTLRYGNSYQDHKKYLTAQGSVSGGTIECQIAPVSSKLVCLDLSGKINRGVEFILVRRK